MTKIKYNGVEVEEFQIHDSGDFIWFAVKTKEGNYSHTCSLKTEV